MDLKFDVTWMSLIALLWSAFCTWFGWWLAVRFSKQEAVRQRRLDLIGFLSRLRSEVDRHKPEAVESYWNMYVSRVPEFYDLSSRVQTDRADDTKLIELFKAVGDIHREQVSDADGDKRAVLCTPIDRLKSYLVDEI